MQLNKGCPAAVLSLGEKPKGILLRVTPIDEIYALEKFRTEIAADVFEVQVSAALA